MSADQQDSDVVLLHSPTTDGGGVRVVRARRGRVELGEVRPIVEGKPISPSGEIVSLKPRPDSPRVCDVEVQYSSARASGQDSTRPTADANTDVAGRTGPAQVATETYRDNWEATFGTRRAALN